MRERLERSGGDAGRARRMAAKRRRRRQSPEKGNEAAETQVKLKDMKGTPKMQAHKYVRSAADIVEANQRGWRNGKEQA